jgi:hypothetical protein
MVLDMIAAFYLPGSTVDTRFSMAWQVPFWPPFLFRIPHGSVDLEKRLLSQLALEVPFPLWDMVDVG